MTAVIQVGLTEREQYIHRLGRTARAGKGGSGILLLASFEERAMMKDLSDMPLQVIAPDSFPASALCVASVRVLQSVPLSPELKTGAEQAYQAWLGFYNTNTRKCGWNQAQLVETANEFSRVIGLTEIPFLEKKTVGMMGLRGVPGLRIR